MYEKMREPEQSNAILTFRYASEKTLLMSADQLLTFLQREQGMSSMDVAEATNLIKEFEMSDLKAKGYMTQDGENGICVCVCTHTCCWCQFSNFFVSSIVNFL